MLLPSPSVTNQGKKKNSHDLFSFSSSASSPVLTRSNKEVGLSVSGVGKQKSITLFLPMRFTAFSSITALNSTFGGWSSSSSSSSSDAVADCADDPLLLMKENVLRFTALSADGLAKPKLFTARSASLEVGFSEPKLKVVVGLTFMAFVSCDLSFTPIALLSVVFELANGIGDITVTLSTVVVFAIFEPLNWNYSERSSDNFEGSVLNSAVEIIMLLHFEPVGSMEFSDMKYLKKQQDVLHCCNQIK
uniref:Uncharacterized protein n=1 Tax=Glossina austeni TaxID=7395 RepID=A0A1A9UKW5_GLOAU